MDSILAYKAFDINKSYTDVIYDASNWISDFNFTKKELLFLKAIIKSNSFKSTIPNLFERLQLLLKDIDDFKVNNVFIINRVEQFKQEVTETLKKDVFSLGKNEMETYQSLEKEIFEFHQKYKNFKAHLYEFLIEII